MLQDASYYLLCMYKRLFTLSSTAMYLIPSLIENLVANFSINGPASLELLPEEDPVNVANASYDLYLGGLNFEEENAYNLTMVGF